MKKVKSLFWFLICCVCLNHLPCDGVNCVTDPAATYSLPSAVYDHLFITVRPDGPQEPLQMILEVLFL